MFPSSNNTICKRYIHAHHEFKRYVLVFLKHIKPKNFNTKNEQIMTSFGRKLITSPVLLSTRIQGYELRAVARN